ncbi:MAG: hypothetical protein AAGC55_03405, partial [Myxococcota bacterium]
RAQAPIIIAEREFWLARAEWSAGINRPLALAAAESARLVFAETLGAGRTLEEMSEWLANPQL